jgi:hypothetical protein
MLRDWLALAGYLGVALVPYLVERLVFKERFGIFALLFWLPALQIMAIYLSVGTARSLEDNGCVFLAGFFKGIGGMAFMTIGVIPFIALPFSILIALAVLAFRLFRQAQ